MLECKSQNKWLKRGFWLNHLGSIFSRPLRNHPSTSIVNSPAKTATYDWLRSGCALVGPIKWPLVGWGGFFRTPTATTQPLKTRRKVKSDE